MTDAVGAEPVCEPDTVPGHGDGTRCKWADPSIDAIFFEGKLRRAEISGAGVEFVAESGAQSGINTRPTFANDNVIKWGVSGFEASLFSDGGRGVSYVYLSDGK
ncbi:hypothetical protein [Enhygromyxa salina]|uniref:hypothetical protein n=1 Tax=Enhygromyxa salina TaxID=215803 RepID=UPI0006985B26|nr:hypothetical protein [Enhygromyxa salina]